MSSHRNAHSLQGRRATQRLLVSLLGLVVLAGAATWTSPSARADSAPVDPAAAATPPTVSADALPTVQIDGVVWSQAVSGNTVYAGGEFTTARPAGAAPGVNTTPRNNLLAYDIRTGALITSFAPDLNAQVKSVALSPDGSRLYVAGNFTTANGQTRYRIAAYDTATGALDPGFRPVVASAVSALAVTDTTVYAGGNFSSAGKQTRSRLAAFSRTDGSLLPWAPTADDRVNALALSPDGRSLIVGGAFTKLTSTDGSSSQTARGLGAVDVATGAALPFTAGTVISNTGSTAAVLSLSVDSDTVYASGYTFGAGTLEGVVAADPTTGAVRWIEDCHGDSYSVWASGTATYVAGHPHVCSNVGGWPQTEPWTFRRGIAFSKAATGKVGTETGNFAGQPAPSLLNWYPTIDAGTYTGQTQGPWSVAGNSQYVVYGGEFPTVNGTRQQGLVRFAMSSTAPNKVGPNTDPGLTPTLTTTSTGAVRVAWQATDDQDNQHLTYRVVRSDEPAQPVYETTADNSFWNRPMLGFVDKDVTPGTTYTYRVYVYDPFGNMATRDTASVTAVAATSTPDAYSDTVAADSPAHQWRLDEPAQSTVSYDQGGYEDLTLTGGVTRAVAGALTGTTNTATTFNGSSGLGASQVLTAGPQVFSEEAWFKTSSTKGGKIIGFGNAKSGLSGSYDRHVYLDTIGRVVFGVYPGSESTVQSSSRYNNGKWHHVVATMGPDGMVLYVDGKQVAQRSDVTTAQAYSGYWRVGGDSGWGNTSKYFNGSIDEPAVYSTVLSADAVARHYQVGTTGRGVNVPPTAAFTSSVDELTANLDGTSSTDAVGSIARWAWDFGDGSAPATGATTTHTYAAGGIYQVVLTVTDDQGLTSAVTHPVTVAAPVPNAAPTASFTSSVSDLAVAVDGSASADTDGTVASYGWDFGDGSAALTGVMASHAYAAAGTYEVVLTVTDDDGATGTLTSAVTVTDPPAVQVLATDAFERAVTRGFGTADSGGSWTTSGAVTAATVSGGAGHVQSPSAGALAGVYLNSVSGSDVAVQFGIALDKLPTGSGEIVYVSARRVGNTDYRAAVRVMANGSMTLGVSSYVNGKETSLRSAPLTGLVYTPGTVLTVRFDVSGTGTTALNAKAWFAGTTEPATWQVSATDTTADLQRPGGVGVAAYLFGSSTVLPRLDVDDLWVGTAGNAPTV